MTFAAPLEAKSIRFRARSFVAFTLTPEAPLDVWLESLDRWIGNSPGYFAGRPVVLDLNVLKPDVVAIEALVGVLGQRGIRIYAMELDGGGELGAHLPPVLVGAKEATTDGLLQPSRKAGRAEDATAASDTKPPPTKPTLKLTATRKQKLSTVKRKGVKIAATPNKTCKLTATVKKGKRRIGRLTRSLKKGKHSLRVKIAKKKDRKRLHAKQKLTVSATCSNAAGKSKTVKRTVKLKRG